MSAGCYVIAEAGLNHNGHMELARSLVNVAAEAGADAVKFQKREVGTLAVGHVLNAQDDRFPQFGSTYKEIRETMEFNFEQYLELKELVVGKGLDFLCTPFDHESVDFLEKLGVERYKIASHSNTNLPLLEHIASIGRPVFMSTGACTLDELDDAVEVFKKHGTDLTVLHCVSAYPTPIEDHNLSMIDIIRQRYGVAVGYSGHELGYIPTLAAVSLGAKVVERHFTMDKKLVGFDHAISLEPRELTGMIEDIRSIGQTLGGVEKFVSEQEMITRDKYKVSMVTRHQIPAGAVITEDMILYRNPGTGIHPRDAGLVLGKKAASDIPEDTLIDVGMLV